MVIMTHHGPFYTYRKMTHKITIDLYNRNIIYDRNGSYEVPFDKLTFDHLKKPIWNDIKGNEEDINKAKQLKLWLEKKSKELDKNFLDEVALKFDEETQLRDFLQIFFNTDLSSSSNHCCNH